MAIRAWLIGTYVQVTGIDPGYRPGFLAAVRAWEDLTGIPTDNIPPAPNVLPCRADTIPDKATLDALDALPGVIVLAAINDDGTRVVGYLRPQDAPTGPQLGAAKTRLQNAGIPTAFLTAYITVGMTLAQIADVLRAWAHDLIKG